jgi:hypothetical protein
LEDSFRARSELLEAPETAQLFAEALGPKGKVSEQDRQQIIGYLGYSKQLANQFALQTVHHRIDMFTMRLRGNVSLSDFHAEIRALREAFQHDINFLYFYHYQTAKAHVLLKVESDWKMAFGAFPSTKEDAKAGVDYYALGHNNAAVFCCALVLEKGLKALAADVGLTFDVQQWKNILDEIESTIAEIRNHGIPGTDKAAKDARLQFLSEAAKDFFYFKDAWRNYVAHGHAEYDEHQALGVLEHTRSFMNHLASKISEGP